MKLSELDLNPPPRKLRQFSWIWCGVFLALAAWHSRHGATPWTPWLAGIGVAGGVLGTVAPRAMKPAFIGLTLVGFPIGLAVNWLALTLLWYGVFTPIGLVFRLRGRDPLHRAIERGRASYWIQRGKPSPPRRYLRQF